MNAAHLHLIVNHAPLFGLIAALLLLVWGSARNSREVRTASYVAFILSALAGVVAYMTGGGAESLVENLPGITEAAIERHEDAAKMALGLIFLSGIGGVVAIFAERGAIALQRAMVVALFACGVITIGVVGYTASLGGLIHHTEITTSQK